MKHIDNKRIIFRELRQFCLGFKNEYARVESVIDQYYLLSDVVAEAKLRYWKRGRRKTIYGYEIMDVIAKTFGVSSQTLYRAKAAVKAKRSGVPPRKYAIKSFRNIDNKIRSW